MQYKSKVDLVYEEIVKKIQNKEIISEQKLSISGLAREYGVSEIPVREALRLLSAQGYVDFKPNFGAYLTTIDEKTIDDIYELKALLEINAAVLASQIITQKGIDELLKLNAEMTGKVKEKLFFEVKKLNKSFHLKIGELSGNRQLSKLIENHWELFLIDSPDFFDNDKNYARAFIEHDDIIMAIKEKNLERIAALIKKHKDYAAANIKIAFRI